MSIVFDEKSGKLKQNEVVRFLTPKGDRIPVRLFATALTKAKLKIEWERKRQVAANTIAEAADGPTGSKTFAAFAEEWLSTYPAAAKNRETTRIEKTYHVRVRLLPYFEKLAAERGGAPLTLAEITPKVIDRLIADLSDSPKRIIKPGKWRRLPAAKPKKLAAQTVRNILQTLRKMLASAKRWGEIRSAPEIHSVKATKTKIDFLTFDEAERLLKAISTAIPRAEEDLALITCGLKAGLRAGELLGLQWSNYDALKRELRIESQIAHEGAEVDGLVPVKAGMRTVPVSEALALALKTIKHLRGPWVFCDADGRPFTRFDLARKLERWLKRAGLRRTHPHTMRHTFASHLVMRGVPIVQVQAWMGHASIAMTMRYAHLAPGTGASMVNVLDQKADDREKAEAK